MISYRESTFLGSSIPKKHSATNWVKLACMIALSFFLTQEAAAQLKIMPLGDSITDGDKSSDLGGYRSRLFNKFKSSGHRTDFVGGQSGGTGFFDTQHEGHGGFSADEIRDNVLAYLGANPPQVVLLMIGTNDLTASQGVNAIRDEISEALERIKQFNPKTEIYQATLTLRKDTKQAQVTQLNNLIEQLVATKQTQGMDITLVKVDGLTNSDLADNVHPNDAGYQKIADKFYNAIIAKHAPSLETFEDDFNRTNGLGAFWNANSAMKIVSNQLKNTSTVDNFDTFLAIATEITNPRLISFKYGTGTDAVGRAFSGLTVMIDNPLFNKANGYLIFHNSQDNPASLRLYEVKNGVPSASPIQKINAEAASPQANDVFQVEVASDAQGHKFTVTLNGVLDGILRDTNRLQGNASELYAGVQINGNTTNAVDDFFATTAADLVAPDEVTDLKFLSATSSTVSLEFTATGDDGKIGAASRYDVRYSTGPINGNNFNGANAANLTKTPNAAGATEQVTVTGLDGGVEY
ncbi:MAG: SGNH/GDSL hydrolase family protein, partial [candidate division KSB1 bacterium]